MTPQVLSALIAAAVSFTGALISFYANRHDAAVERQRQERELQRRLTERLLDARLQCYPAAFEISDALVGSRVFSDSLTKEDLAHCLDRLAEWNRTRAALLLSNRSLDAFYDLRGALEGALRSEAMDEAVRKRVYEAKNHFRRSLRADVHLLYGEESAGGRGSRALRPATDTRSASPPQAKPL